MTMFSRFMTDRADRAVMVLRGSAGTGKTTLAAAIVRALAELKQKMVLMAPTGRAAKVFSLYAGYPAYTIHRRIYRQKSLEGGFDLNFNSAHDTLFIVDESSMIANGDTPLLDDLIRFVYNDHNCRLMLIGDQAQLPPVGEEESPALMADVLRVYGLRVFESDLREVLRQSQESGILYNATKVRNEGLAMSAGPVALPRVRFAGFTDIRCVPGDELIESLASSYSRVGLDDTIVVTHVTMTFPDYDDYELTATTMLDTLSSEAPALTREQQERLFQQVLEDYADVPLKQDRMKKLKEDRYYNALQIKFAYAATCHKAQGGQWAHVYVDQGYMTDDMLNADYLHWLYTAFTRATERLFLVNWPKTQAEDIEPQ